MKYAAEAWTMTRGISEQFHTIVDDNVDFDIDILKLLLHVAQRAMQKSLLGISFL